MFIHLMGVVVFIYLAARLVLPLRAGWKTKAGLAALLLFITQQHFINRRAFGGLASPEIPSFLLLAQGW